MTPDVTDSPRRAEAPSTTMELSSERHSPTARGRDRQHPPRHTAVDRVRAGIWSVLVLVVLGAVVFGAFSVLSGNWTVTPILSGSMRPGFSVGGVAVAERVPADRLAVGDVILFQNPFQRSVEMVHRIVELKINKSGQPVIRTKGDANPVPDPWTVTLRGKYVYMAQFTLPLLGYPAVYTSHGLDLIVAGLIVLGVVVATVLTETRKRETRPKRASTWP